MKNFKNQLNVKEQNSKDNFWKNVIKQQSKYGSIDVPEVDWGNNVGSEKNY